MRHLVIIRIKNSDFNYTKYGLQQNYFSIDITKSISYSKNVGVTQYALLDGTTRADNISREPATLTLQGLLAEVRGGGTNENFVQDTVVKNRLQNQMDLLEALRDQAIFLDFITDERTYRNYLITGLSFGKSNMSQVDVNINIREMLTFGDEIDVENNQRQTQMSDYEQSIVLNDFYMRSIENDIQLVDEVFRIITSSNLSTPYIISFGPVEINPDVVFPSLSIRKQTTQYQPVAAAGAVRVVRDTNALTGKYLAAEILSGTVVDDYSLHISTPNLAVGTSLYSTKLIRNSNGSVQQINQAETPLHIRLKRQDDQLYAVQKSSVLMTPSFSDVVNGVHYLNTSGSRVDVISTARYSLCFIRKQKNNKYSLLPNILGSERFGYMYSGTYEAGTGSSVKLHPVMVYIHPRAWAKIKSEVRRIWSESQYFKNKELIML